MQFTTVFALLVAAVGISAAPSQMSQRAASIPLNIYLGDGCNDSAHPNPVATANVPTDGSCFPISPIVSGNTDSGRIDVPGSLPAGCKLVVYSNTTCSSVNFIQFTETGRCSTLSAPQFIRSAKAVGTCA